VLGVFVGFGGWRLAEMFPAAVNVPSILAIIAGLLLIWQGLEAAGVLRWSRRPAGAGPCLAGTFFASFLTGRHWLDVFLAGLFTGLLPCGLVYAMLALAGSTGDIFLAVGTMFAFGLGTMPVMIATGCSGTLLGVAARRKLFVVAAWCVVVTGALSVARGAWFLETPWNTKPKCPFCAADGPAVSPGLQPSAPPPPAPAPTR
ncbi:MAG: sulfite exporter TauE/SafE family protein, partial [Planctomycetales bacterium]|nr:sulfite exporter TauE/SafE family protein [Planctomycetales bacterium]